MPVPKPNAGEKETEFVSRCISTMNKRDPNTPQDQVTAMCYGAWRRRKEKMVDFQYKTPINIIENAGIEETDSDKDAFLIQGSAINATVTRNNISYIDEELEPAAQSLSEKPLLKDHDNKTDSVVGKVVKSYYNSDKKAVMFKAQVMDKKIKEMIRDGRLNNVSIGARAKLDEAEEDGPKIARNIEFLELSIVPIPGDSKANFSQALAESYNKESDEADDAESQEEDEMANEKIEELKKQLKEKDKKLKALAEKERSKLLEEYSELAGDAKVDNAESLPTETLSTLVSQIKTLQENDEEEEQEEEKTEEKDEEKEEPEKKAETKGEVGDDEDEEEEEKKEEKYLIEKRSNGFTLSTKVDARGRFIRGE